MTQQNHNNTNKEHTMVKRKKVSAKQKQVHHKHFFVGGVTAFFLAGLLLGGVVLVDLSAKGQFSDSVHAFLPSQVISNGTYDVQLSSVSRGVGEAGSLKPGVDKTYLIVDLYVKNKSDKTLPLYPLEQAYIKDDQGQTYGIGPAMVVQPFQVGDLAAGDKVKGQIAFEIPVSLQNPRFYLEGLSDSPVVVQL